MTLAAEASVPSLAEMDELTAEPPDSTLRYTRPLERMMGVALDSAFYHIILKFAVVVAIERSFHYGAIWPATLFTLAYLGFLFLWLSRKGLTPGGLILRYRVVNSEMKPPNARSAAIRLLPHALHQLASLWLLQHVLTGFLASGQSFLLAKRGAIFEQHGGMWNRLLPLLGLFVVIDLARVFRDQRRRSWTDLWAGTFVVSQRDE